MLCNLMRDIIEVNALDGAGTDRVEKSLRKNIAEPQLGKYLAFFIIFDDPVHNLKGWAFGNGNTGSDEQQQAQASNPS